MLTLPQLILEGIMLGGIYALAASGLTLILGVMRFLNLAHGTLITVAMFLTFFLWTFVGLNPFLSILVSFPVLFALGLVLYKGIVSHAEGTSVENQMLITIGLIFVIRNALSFTFGEDYRSLMGFKSTPFTVIGLRFVDTRLMAFSIAVAITISLYFIIAKTGWGRAVRACSQDPEAAAMRGINVERIRITSFAIGIGLAGGAGSVLAAIRPIYPMAGFEYILAAVVIVILGGMGSIFGALVGGFIVGIVETLTSFYLVSQVKMVGVFIIFVLILLIRPHGLFGRKGRVI